MGNELTPEDKHIHDRGPGISAGVSAGWLNRVTAAFPALRSRNYKLYFTGQFISLTGTWLQVVAQGWLVLKLTNSAFLVGFVAGLATLPMLIFSLFGGVIVDRFPKRKILLFTQAASMALAFILGLLTVLGLINVTEISVLAFLLGTVNAIDAPARQAFVIEMVERESLASAIALNSGIFNGARVIGPGIAGFLIAAVGTGGTFLINSLTYVAVIIALAFIDVKRPPGRKAHPSPLLAIKEGLGYSFTHPVIRTLLILAGVTSVFGWSYAAMLPVVAQNIFHLDAAGLGHLYAASGLGALVATILVSLFSERISPLWFIFGGNTLFAFSLILFTFTSSLTLALPLLFLSGLGILSQFSMMNATIQRLVEDSVRGRVMSIYVLMFIGLTPFGSFEAGILSERFGPAPAIRLGALIVFAFGVLVFLKRGRIREPHRRRREGGA